MKTKISTFLKERQNRFKPEEANKLNLKRLQKIDFSGNMHFLDNKKTNTGMILIKSGDLVISGINVEKGAVAVYQGEGDILATIHYSSYEFDKNKIDINYFKWFLKSDAFRKAVQSQTRGGIKTELKPKKFLPLEIDLPDIEEQREILYKINKVENEIKQLETNISHDKKLLTSLKQSILSEAVQGKLVKQNPKDEPARELLKKIKKEKEKLVNEGKIKKGKELPAISGDEVPYELPGGWVWCRLGEVCETINDGVHYAPIYLKKGLPSISAKDIYNSKINLANCNYVSEDEYSSQKEKFGLKVNSLLVTKSGSIGRTAIFNGDFPLHLVESIGVINTNNSFVDSKYIKYLLDSIFTEITYKGSHVRGLGVKHLTLTLLGKIPFPLPPLSEQQRIVEKVDALMRFCDELELRIKENKESSERLMEAVLREVFEN